MITRFKVLATFLLAIFFLLTEVRSHATQAQDPAAWGGNHVGKPVPEFVHGDECLFCHRNNIGATWQKNAHALTVRQLDDAPDLAPLKGGHPSLAKIGSEVEYFLGSRHRVRFLKKDGYGKFALLNTQVALGPDHKPTEWLETEKPAWVKDKFANRCAGCHTTGIDGTDKTFAAFGLDCYTCHGIVDLNHSNDTSLVLLAKKAATEAKVVTSICAQCHLRGSESRSTGTPYPNNFAPGDNLFKDLKVDFALADDAKLNAGDRHIYRNVRDVVILGKNDVTCLSCHQVHANTSQRHRRALRAPICFDCHNEEGSFKNVKPWVVRSPICEY
jgi:predicted CXXCH cytochrome family protein